MKRLLLAAVAVAALGTAPTFAADLAARPYTKAPPIEPLPTWAGFYIGVMGGYASDNSAFAPLKGGFAGGTAGYNWQTGSVVFGIEADAAWADVNSTFTQFGVTANDKIRDMGTVRGRIGYAFGQVLLYGTGGYAWADNSISFSAPGVSISASHVHSGWTAGGGVEYMFAPKWSVKGEYLYKSFGNENYTFAGIPAVLSTGTFAVHSGQVGINYHF